MNAIRPFRIPLAALALAGAALLGTGAACAGGSLPVHDVNGVIYVSGGVGKDESTFLRSVQTQWPASFEFAARAGQKSDFVAGAVVSVFDAQGRATWPVPAEPRSSRSSTRKHCTWALC